MVLPRAKMKSILKKKYQPQWSFSSKKSAMDELDFQKKVNPQTYKWLKPKIIKIRGKKVPVKTLLKK